MGSSIHPSALTLKTKQMKYLVVYYDTDEDSVEEFITDDIKKYDKMIASLKAKAWAYVHFTINGTIVTQ